jgi:hypothetical protein
VSIFFFQGNYFGCLNGTYATGIKLVSEISYLIDTDFKCKYNYHFVMATMSSIEVVVFCINIPPHILLYFVYLCLQVNISELGLVTQGGKVIWGKCRVCLIWWWAHKKVNISICIIMLSVCGQVDMVKYLPARQNTKLIFKKFYI